MSYAFDSRLGEQLYWLLPEVYRTRDKKAGRVGEGLGSPMQSPGDNARVRSNAPRRLLKRLGRWKWKSRRASSGWP